LPGLFARQDAASVFALFAPSQSGHLWQIMIAKEGQMVLTMCKIANKQEKKSEEYGIFVSTTI
jgi:hypothetical protein